MQLRDVGVEVTIYKFSLLDLRKTMKRPGGDTTVNGKTKREGKAIRRETPSNRRQTPSKVGDKTAKLISTSVKKHESTMAYACD